MKEDKNEVLALFKFEWDPQKSLQSKGKHNISMEEAVDLFKENYESTIQLKVAENPEVRYAMMFYKDYSDKRRFYRLIFTMKNTVIRIISIHRRDGGEELKLAKRIWFEKENQ